ncbi:MAG TPA: hypothetical protein VEJ00_08700 [Candidatus Acidoferrales bacterium]|nr:hypothetical protein [Candidatus Acidoferrales bacterium]
MRGCILALFSGLVLLGSLASGQETKPPQTQNSSYETLSNQFFDFLKQGKSSEAVDFLFETNPALKKMTDDATQLKTQFASVETLMGSYVSHTKLVETTVGGMFVYQHFFVAYERQPISVRIEYYKPGSKWLCYSLQFDGKLTDKVRSLSDERISIEAK